MNNTKLLSLFTYAAVTGNIVFILWIMFNAMDEGFKGTLPEKASMIGLIGLLALNSTLIANKAWNRSVTNGEK